MDKGNTELMNSSDWIAIIGVLCGLIVFMVGIFLYYRAQKWKRAEFVAKEIK